VFVELNLYKPLAESERAAVPEIVAVTGALADGATMAPVDVYKLIETAPDKKLPPPLVGGAAATN